MPGNNFKTSENGSTFAGAMAAARTYGGDCTVHLDEEEYLLSGWVRTTRTTLGRRGSIRIVGEGPDRTRVVCLHSVEQPWTDPAVIAWDDPAGAGDDINRTWRTWSQCIEGMTITLPRTACIGIHYERKRSAADIATYNPGFEKFQGTFRDLHFETYNDFPQACIKLEGNVHDCLFENIKNDPGQVASSLYDVPTFVADDGAPTFLDDYIWYSCTFRGITNTPTRGGYATIFTGRACASTFKDIQAGRGSLGTPQIRLVNSFATSIEGMVTEGFKESPQILVDHCRGVDISTLVLGTPDPAGGDGIAFVASHDFSVRRWPSIPGVPAWHTVGGGKKRVTIDAACSAYDVDIGITDDGHGGRETFDRVVTDLAKRGRVRVTDARTGRVVERVNGVDVRTFNPDLVRGHGRF